MREEMSESKPNSRMFWGEIAPSEHCVQFYEDDEAFFDALLGFVSEGILNDECVIVLLTESHRKVLEEKLKADAIDIDAATAAGQYVCRDAQEILGKFLVKDWPDPELFEQEIKQLLNPAQAKGRRVRAFGELVAILWAQGFNGATVNLEHLWHNLCESENFALFCAYPKAGITQECSDSFKEICDTHNRVIGHLPALPGGADGSRASDSVAG